MNDWQVADHQLMLGGRTVDALARRFGTPLYLYDGEMILSRLTTLRSAFPGFRLMYSIKANPNATIVRALTEAQMGADVQSIPELRLARAVGPPGLEVTYVGPGKRRSDLLEAIRAKVDVIVVESQRELDLLDEIGRELGTEVPVAVRINTLHRPSSAGEIMSGIPSQFGIDEEAAPALLRETKREFVRHRGIHAHVASQVLDSRSLENHFETLARLAKQISTSVDLPLELINFGGGLGVPYSELDKPLDLRTLGRRVRSRLNRIFPEERRRPEFYLELGRWIVAAAGIFVTQVIDVKVSRNTTFVITDCGITGMSRPAMPWAQPHSCSIVTKERLPPSDTYDVVGPSCLPSDVLCRKVPLPSPAPGDLIAVRNAGAYGFSMSMVLWGTFPPPREVTYIDGEFDLAPSRFLERVAVSQAH